MTLDVLFAARRLLPAFGGGERYALELLAHLAPRHRIRAVWVADERAAGSSITALPPGVEGTEVPPVTDSNPTRRRRRREERLERALRSAVLARRPDVMIAQVGAEAVATSLGDEQAVPVVVLLPAYDTLCRLAFVPGNRCRPSSGCLECSVNGRTASRRRLARERQERLGALHRASRLVAPSRAVAAIYEEWTGLRPIAVPPVSEPLRPARVHADGHVLLAVSNWSKEKGVDLLEALAHGLPERRLVVSRRFLSRSLVRRLSSAGNVELARHAPIDELLDGAALVLVPSQWPEPFGRIAFEAMSAGVPVLASAIGGLPELVPTLQLVSPPGSPDAWVAAVREHADPARWSAARERGREAAGAILATRPIEHVERILESAAAE
jgi:glycosyltransferase involved in cell wall biosynthesis